MCRECRSREVVSFHVQDALITKRWYGWSNRSSRSHLWCSWLLCKLLRPGNTWCISECILPLPENVPREHPITTVSCSRSFQPCSRRGSQ